MENEIEKNVWCETLHFGIGHVWNFNFIKSPYLNVNLVNLVPYIQLRIRLYVNSTPFVMRENLMLLSVRDYIHYFLKLW